MGLGDRLRAWFDTPRDRGLTRWVVATVVPFRRGADGPLGDRGRKGSPRSSSGCGPSPAHSQDQYRIVVRQADLAEAEAILEDLRAPGPPRTPSTSSSERGPGAQVDARSGRERAGSRGQRATMRGWRGFFTELVDRFYERRRG